VSEGKILNEANLRPCHSFLNKVGNLTLALKLSSEAVQITESIKVCRTNNRAYSQISNCKYY